MRRAGISLRSNYDGRLRKEDHAHYPESARDRQLGPVQVLESQVDPCRIRATLL